MKGKYHWLKSTTTDFNTVRSTIHYHVFFPVAIFGVMIGCAPWLFPHQDPELAIPAEGMISISLFFGVLLFVFALDQVHCYELTPTALVRHSLLRDKTIGWDAFKAIVVVRCSPNPQSNAQGVLLSKRLVDDTLRWSEARMSSSNEQWLIGIPLRTAESYEETKYSAYFDKRVFMSYMSCHGIEVEDRTL